jgi:hypothetical protein
MTAKTLRKHYFTELKLRQHEAREQLAAESLLMIWDRAACGSVRAMKTMRELLCRE